MILILHTGHITVRGHIRLGENMPQLIEFSLGWLVSGSKDQYEADQQGWFTIRCTNVLKLCLLLLLVTYNYYLKHITEVYGSDPMRERDIHRDLFSEDSLICLPPSLKNIVHIFIKFYIQI